jgi:phospholipid/cholesterol/gamma-HCH transport system substrate-binding protein
MERPPVPATGIRYLRLKVGVVLLLAPVALIALAVYALNARGFFEPSRTFVLEARDAEGLGVGTQVTLAGFPLGSVRTMSLADDGRVRVEIVVREKDARWIRTSSTFTVQKSIMGAAHIEIASPQLSDPQLPIGAQRPLTVADAMQGLPEVIARVDAVLRNAEAITRGDGSLARSLSNIESITARTAGPGGAMEALTGDAGAGRRVTASVEQVQALGVSLNRTAARLDRLLAEADRKLMGRDGTADESRKAMAQMTALMTDLRASVLKLDATLENTRNATADLRTLSANAKDAGADLADLRAQVDESVRRADDLLREMNRKWPFARDSKVRLP